MFGECGIWMSKDFVWEDVKNFYDMEMWKIVERQIVIEDMGIIFIVCFICNFYIYCL